MGDEIVYRTKRGSVVHCNRDCSQLKGAIASRIKEKPRSAVAHLDECEWCFGTVEGPKTQSNAHQNALRDAEPDCIGPEWWP